jgi:hypothetical protein
MSINLNPLFVIVPAWIVGMSLLGIARMVKQRAEKQLKPATVHIRNDH